MKALLILSAALLAGSLSAQTSQSDPTLRTVPLPPTREQHLVLTLQDTSEFQWPGYTVGGIGVELFHSADPLNLFNPFNTEVRAAAHDNVSWDMHGRPLGFNLLSIRF